MVAPVILSVIPEAVLPLIELNIPKPRTPIILDPSSGNKVNPVKKAFAKLAIVPAPAPATACVVV